MTLNQTSRLAYGAYRSLLAKKSLALVSSSSSSSKTLLLQGVRASSTVASSSSAYQKLVDILEEYREKNYGQTLFSRFVKETVTAMDVNHDGKISLSELQKLLVNIGAQSSLSESELMEVMDEFGHVDEKENEKVIDTLYIEDLILNGVHPKAA